MAQTSIRLHPAAAERLKQLKAALNRGYVLRPTNEELVGALIAGTSPAQASGMLVEFLRNSEPASEPTGDELESDVE